MDMPNQVIVVKPMSLDVSGLLQSSTLMPGIEKLIILTTVEAPASRQPWEADKFLSVHNWSWLLMGMCNYRVCMN